jgi:hypothetical protein
MGRHVHWIQVSVVLPVQVGRIVQSVRSIRPTMGEKTDNWMDNNFAIPNAQV